MNRTIEKNLNRCSVVLLCGLERVAGVLGMKKYCQRFMVHLVRRTGLFDETYYRRNNPDVVADGYDPILHYVAYGDQENRLPMPLFDPAHYRHNTGRYRPGNLNTLVHYTLIGRFKGVASSPWFDTAYYLATNRDVKFKGVDPLFHFLKYGGREGRSPCVTFDAARYLFSHPEVANAGINPLLHHLDCVRTIGEAGPCHRATSPLRCPRAVPPAPRQWRALQLPQKSDAPVVDVIIPVYKGKAETLHCIFNVLHFEQQTRFELLVIDDASPAAGLSRELGELAEKHHFTYIKNDTNIGYVRSVNVGMKRHPDRDVVLLNSDTQPCNGWLDRLRATAGRDPRTATVTPLSNNATICSYPVFDRDNPCPLEVTSETLDHIARRVNADHVVEAPTAVGFCMYIKRECLNDIGLFDEAAFNLGYGEENDFCQRAIHKNWKHVIAPNIFVWHWGARSFKGAKGRRIKKSLTVVTRRYPNYKADVAAFVAEDPLRAARRRMDEARLLRQVSNHNVLVVTHNRGGGTERSIMAYGRRLRRKGANLFFLTPLMNNRHCVRLSSVKASHLPNLDVVDFRIPGSVLKILKKYRINRVHVHQLVDFDDAAPRVIATCAKQAGVRLEVFVHDYQSVCPRINMVDSSGVYCGAPDEKSCNACLKKKRPGATTGSDTDIRSWRRRYAELFTAAAKVSVPDRDVKTRIGHWFPDCRVTVQPPESLVFPGRKQAPYLMRPGESLRIVVVGAIVPIKGFHVLKACARDVQKRRLPIEFIVMGYTKNDRVITRLGVTVTGRYRDGEAVETLQSLAPDMVWLPSIWPETYSYTLSLALSSGADIAAFDLGAIARRLRSAGRGDHLHPLGWARRPVRINDEFLQVRKHRIRQGRTHFSFVDPIQAVP